MSLLDFIFEIENPQSGTTTTIPNLLKSSSKSMARELKVCLPAQILRYDHKKQQADVQPYLKKKYSDGKVVDMPPIYNVPVVHPRAGDAFIHIPLKKGHNVTLVFCDRSLEKWLSQGGAVDPEDTRMHHLSDAVAFPGLYPFNDAQDIANPDDIIIKNGVVEMRIKPNNHFQILNQSQEFVKVLNDMLQILREAVVYTSSGTQQLRHAQFAQVAARLKTFLEV